MCNGQYFSNGSNRGLPNVKCYKRPLCEKLQTPICTIALSPAAAFESEARDTSVRTTCATCVTNCSTPYCVQTFPSCNVILYCHPPEHRPPSTVRTWWASLAPTETLVAFVRWAPWSAAGASSHVDADRWVLGNAHSAAAEFGIVREQHRACLCTGRLTCAEPARRLHMLTQLSCQSACLCLCLPLQGLKPDLHGFDLARLMHEQVQTRTAAESWSIGSASLHSALSATV